MNRDFDICIKQILNPYCNNGIQFPLAQHPLESSNLIIEDDSSLEKRFNPRRLLLVGEDNTAQRTIPQIASLLFGEICEELTTKLQQTARVIIFDTPHVEQSFLFDRNPDGIILKSRFDSISSTIPQTRDDPASWTTVEKWQLVEELLNKFRTSTVSPPEFGERTTMLFNRFDYQEDVLHKVVKNRVFNVYLHLFPFRFEIIWTNGAFVVNHTAHNVLLGDRVQVALAYIYSYIQHSKNPFVNVEWRLFHSRAIAFGISLTALSTWKNAFPTKVINLTLSVANEYYLSPRSFLLAMSSKLPAKTNAIFLFYFFVMVVWRFVPFGSVSEVIDQALNAFANANEITLETVRTLVTDALKKHFHPRQTSDALKDWDSGDNCFELPIEDGSDGFWSYMSESLYNFLKMKKETNALAEKSFQSVVEKHVKLRDFFENRSLLTLKVAQLFEAQVVQDGGTNHLDLKTKSGKIHQLPPAHFLKEEVLTVLNELVLFLLTKSEIATVFYYISRAYNFEINEGINWMRLFGKDFVSYHAMGSSFIGIDWSWGHYYGKDSAEKYSKIPVLNLQRDVIDKRWSFVSPGQLTRVRKLKRPEHAVITIFFPAWLVAGTTAKIDLFQARNAMIEVLATQIGSRIFYGFSDQDIAFVSSKFLAVLLQQRQPDDNKLATFELCKRASLETISSLFFVIKCFSVHPRYKTDWKETIFSFLLYRIAPNFIKPPPVPVYTLNSTELTERLDQLRTRVPSPPKKKQKSPNKKHPGNKTATNLEDENWLLEEQKRKAQFKDLYLRMMKYGIEKNVDTSLMALVAELDERVQELKQIVELLKTDESQKELFRSQSKRLDHMQTLLSEANKYLEKQSIPSKNKRAVLLSKYPEIAKQQGVSLSITTTTTTTKESPVKETTTFKTPEKQDPEKTKNEEIALLVALNLWEYSEEFNRSFKDNKWLLQNAEHIVHYLNMARHIIHNDSPTNVICIPRSTWAIVQSADGNLDKKFLIEKTNFFELKPAVEEEGDKTKYKEYYDNRYQWLSKVEALEDVLFLSQQQSSPDATSKMNGANSIYHLVEKMDAFFVRGEKLPPVPSSDDFQIFTSDPVLHFRALLSFLPLEFVNYGFSDELVKRAVTINRRLITGQDVEMNKTIAHNFAIYVGNEVNRLFLRFKNFQESYSKKLKFYEEELVASKNKTPTVYRAFYIPHKFQIAGLDDNMEENPYDNIWQERYQLLPTVISKIKYHEYKLDEEGKKNETLQVPGVFYVIAKSTLKNKKHVGGIPLIVVAVLFDHSVIPRSFDKHAFVSYLVHYNYIFQWERGSSKDDDDSAALARIRTLFNFTPLRTPDLNLDKPSNEEDALDFTNFLDNQSFLDLLVQNKVPRLANQASFDGDWHFHNHRTIHQIFDYARATLPIRTKETRVSLGKQYMTPFIGQEFSADHLTEMENAETFVKSFVHLFQWFMKTLSCTLVHIRELRQTSLADASFRIELAISFLEFLLAPFQVPYSRFYFDWIKKLGEDAKTPIMKLDRTKDLNALLWRVFQQHPLQLEANLPEIELDASKLAQAVIIDVLSQKWEMVEIESTGDEEYKFDFLVDEEDRTEEEFLELESNKQQQSTLKFRIRNDFELSVKIFASEMYGEIHDQMDVGDLLSGGLIPIDNESINGIREVLNGDEDPDMIMTELSDILAGEEMTKVITFLDKKCDISLKQVFTFVTLGRIANNNEFMDELYKLCEYLFGFFQIISKDNKWKFTNWGKATKNQQRKLAVPLSKKNDIGPNQAPLVNSVELFGNWKQLVRRVILDFNIVSLYEETQNTQISGDKLLTSFILQMDTLRNNAKNIVQVFVPYKPSSAGGIIQLKAEELEQKTRALIQGRVTSFSEGLLSLRYQQKMSHQDYLSNRFYNLAMQKKHLPLDFSDKQRELAHWLFYFPDSSTERIRILDQQMVSALKAPVNANEIKIVLKVRVVKRGNIAFLTPNILSLIREKEPRFNSWEALKAEPAFVKKNLVVLAKFELAQSGVASGEKHFFYEPLVWNLE